MTGIALPSNPYSIPFEGGQMNNGALLQYISALSANGGPTFGNFDLYADATALGITYTAAGLLKGMVRRSGGAGISDTLPTAAQLAAQWPGIQIGSTALVLICNLNSGTITIVTGSGITLAGTTTIVTVAARLYVLSVQACPVNIVGLSYSGGIVTITTAQPHGLASGGTAVVANLVNSAFDGSFTVLSTGLTSYTFQYSLAATTAFATNSIVPNPQVQAPGLLNTTTAMTFTGAFSWPATMIA